MRWSVSFKRRADAIVAPQEVNEEGKEGVRRYQQGWCGPWTGRLPIARDNKHEALDHHPRVGPACVQQAAIADRETNQT